jgi:hypothetical protein
MFSVKCLASAIFLLTVCLFPVFAQVPKEAQPASFLRSNDQFALELLKT